MKVIIDTHPTHQVRYLRFPVFWVCEYQMKVITETRRTKRQEIIDIQLDGYDVCL
jgi:hypothetical protein